MIENGSQVTTKGDGSGEIGLVKSPSFFAQYGRKPIAGKDYDPDGSLCQDDYEYFTGTGQYSDSVSPEAGVPNANK